MKRKIFLKGFFLLIAINVVVFSLAVFADESWTPEKMMVERGVGNTALSPNGKWVAYPDQSCDDGRKK